jgi:hypothetical protein
MSKPNILILSGVIFFTLALAGCDQNSGSSRTTAATSSTSAPAKDRMIYLGEVELSKHWPVRLTVEETNVLSITTLEMPAGALNLDIAIEAKNGPTTHANVTTRNGQQFTMQVGNITVGCVAKLKLE